MIFYTTGSVSEIYSYFPCQTVYNCCAFCSSTVSIFTAIKIIREHKRQEHSTIVLIIPPNQVGRVPVVCKPLWGGGLFYWLISFSIQIWWKLVSLHFCLPPWDCYSWMRSCRGMCKILPRHGVYYMGESKMKFRLNSIFGKISVVKWVLILMMTAEPCLSLRDRLSNSYILAILINAYPRLSYHYLIYIGTKVDYLPSFDLNQIHISILV